jgi:toxin YoeB
MANLRDLFQRSLRHDRVEKQTPGEDDVEEDIPELINAILEKLNCGGLNYMAEFAEYHLKEWGLPTGPDPMLGGPLDEKHPKAYPFERLVGDLRGAYSRRINIQHRLVYQVLEEERIVKVLRMWTRYE